MEEQELNHLSKLANALIADPASHSKLTEDVLKNSSCPQNLSCAVQAMEDVFKNISEYTFDNIKGGIGKLYKADNKDIRMAGAALAIELVFAKKKYQHD